MSLRSVGNQLLQTAPSLVLAGATKVSASFWVQVNPGNNVSGASGVVIFGDAGGKFSAKLSGTGSLHLQWSSNDGHSNGVSTCTLALTPGKSYHVAATWQPGSQQYYLNGMQVRDDIQVGSLGVLGDAATHPFRLGSDQTGADVTLDQPTFWVGYALTSRDVVNLRDRSVQPGGIAPASIALEWSLAGPAGVSAKAGDAGLADASPNGLALSSIVGAAPAYQAGDLSYVASPAIGKLVAAPSGRSIVLIPQDGNGVNANITAILSPGEIQSIALTGTPAGNAFALSFGGQTTAPIPVTAGMPLLYCLWTFPTVSGHSYNLAIAPPHSQALAFLYELFEGSTVVATHQGTGSDTTGTTDPGVTNGNGNLIPWIPIFTGVSATGSSIQIRITCTSEGNLQTAGIRVQDVTAGTITYYDPAGPNFSGANVFVFAEGNGLGGHFGGNNNTGGFGLGPKVTVTGDAPALQSALQALSAIGIGGVTVTDLSGIGSGKYQVAFVGANSNQSKSLITATDPAVSISEVSRGGVFPTLSINGGSPTLLTDWLWVTAGDNPAALGVLPQSAPTVQTFPVGSIPYSPGNGWNSREDGTSLCGQPIYGAASGQTASFPFQVLPPGTYRIAVTYSNAGFTVGDTIYTPATNTQFLVKDAFGHVLATLSVDQSAMPSDYTNGGRGWKILGSFTTDSYQNGLTVVMNTIGLANTGHPTPVAVLDGVQLTRTSADASMVVGPTDSATISFPSGWMTTSAGPLPATNNVPVSPPSPTSILPPFVADQKTMKVGYNVEPVAYFFNSVSHTNLATMFATWLGVARDSDGYPTKLAKDPFGPSGQANAIVTGGANNFILNTGRYTFSWDGTTTNLFLTPLGQGTTITPVPGLATITSGVGNRIIYDIQIDPILTLTPAFRLSIDSNVIDPSDPSGNTFLCDIRNLKIYPPDPADPTGQTAWANPPKFHPWYLDKLRGMQSLRFLDPTNVNNNGVHAFSDYKPATHLDRSGPSRTVSIPVASVSPAPVNLIPPGYGTNYGLAVQVTTSVPHGLYDNCSVNLAGVGDINLAGGGTLSAAESGTNLDQRTQQITTLTQVIDATNIILYCQTDRPHAMTGVVTPTSATLNAVYGSCWPLQDMVDLTRAVGCSDFWMNISIASDTTVGGCVDQTAAFLAANLPAGVKVHVEFGNECWNLFFPTCFGATIKNGFLTGDYKRYVYTTYYVSQAKAVHDRFLAVFAAAGRPDDVICVYGGQQGQPGNAADIATKVTAIGGRMDEYAVAFYFNNANTPHYWEASQQSIYDRMTSDQCLDFMEFNSVHGQMDLNQQAIMPALAGAGHASTRLVGYEGSPDILVPGGPACPNYTVRQNAVKRHPRMFWVMLNQAQIFQDNGLTLWNYFDVAGASNEHAWDAWESGNQQAGTGDPSLDVVNVTNPQAKNLVKSEVGGAWRYWSTLSKAVSTIIKKKPTPGRNGQVGAIGLFKGVSKLMR
jgi:hypothetical protein